MLTKLQDIYASSGVMLIAGFVQCFIFCNCAQIVKTSSMDFSRALYNSYWYQLKRIDQRKTVLLMLTQSQKDIEFSAGGYTVSLELFMSVS